MSEIKPREVSLDEFLRLIREVPDKDVRRILNTLGKYCKRLEGRIRYRNIENEYITFQCIFPDKDFELLSSLYGSGLLSLVGIVRDERVVSDVSNITIPDDFRVELSSGEKSKGIDVSITKGLEPVRWKIRIRGLKEHEL